MNISRRPLLSLLATLPFGATRAVDAATSAYPGRSIRLLVGFAPGGASDLHTRMLGEGMARSFGQPVYVDNKPGAAGGITAQLLATAAPDGYTLATSTSGAMTIRPHLEKLPYDTFRDFEPITTLTTNDAIIVVDPNFPASTFPEFIEVLKASPNKYSWGSSGAGSILHLGGEKIKGRFGIKMTHVPYRGDADAMAGLLNGTLPIAMPVLSSVAPLIKAGKGKPIATLGAVRLKSFPDIPTAAEYGYPDLVISSWIGFFAPKGTSASIIDQLYETAKKTMTSSAVTDSLDAVGAKVVVNTPAEFAIFLKKDYQGWGDTIRQANIQLN